MKSCGVQKCKISTRRHKHQPEQCRVVRLTGCRRSHSHSKYSLDVTEHSRSVINPTNPTFQDLVKVLACHTVYETQIDSPPFILPLMLPTSDINKSSIDRWLEVTCNPTTIKITIKMQYRIQLVVLICPPVRGITYPSCTPTFSSSTKHLHSPPSFPLSNPVSA